MDNRHWGKGWTEYGHVGYRPCMDTTDKRWRGAPPKTAPEGMKTVSRVKAAELAGVTPRTITRWADAGTLVKYAGPRGDVRFSAAAVRKLRKDPDDRQRPAEEPEETSPEPAPPPRW